MNCAMQIRTRTIHGFVCSLVLLTHGLLPLLPKLDALVRLRYQKRTGQVRFRFCDGPRTPRARRNSSHREEAQISPRRRCAISGAPVALLAATAAPPRLRRGQDRHDPAEPRPGFGYASSAPLDYKDRGVVLRRGPITCTTSRF